MLPSKKTIFKWILLVSIVVTSYLTLTVFVSQALLESEFQVNSFTTNTQNITSHHSVAADAAGNFIAVWTSNGQDGAQGGIYAQRFNSNGDPVCPDGTALSNCPDDSDDSNGKEPEFRINTTTAKAQQAPQIGMDSAGNFVVIWESLDQVGAFSGFDVIARHYDNTGTATTAEFVVHTGPKPSNPSADVAMNASGNFAVSWHAYDSDNSGIFFQRYDSSANPIGSITQANTYETSQQRIPSIAMDNSGNFVIAWESNGQDGDGFGVFAQRFDNTGSPLGSEFQANTFTTASQASTKAAMDGSGNFVIAWANAGAGICCGNVSAQAFDNTGTPVGTEFQVNTLIAGGAFPHSIAMDTGGDYVITWETYQVGSDENVFMQVYDSNHNKVGSETRVNTTTPDRQTASGSSLIAGQQLTIIWTSRNQDGDIEGIFGLISADDDSDDLFNIIDNCPSIANPSQTDSNGDGAGDACQPTVAISSIDEDAGSNLEVEASIDDPNSDALSGEIKITSESSTVAFTKTDFGSEQDCITANVCLTRGNSKPIYNSVIDTFPPNNAVTPSDTEWAVGTCDNPGSLTFDAFIPTAFWFPPSIVEVDMCLHLITDDLFFDIIFQNWTSGAAGGGFSYIRKDQTTEFFSVPYTTALPTTELDISTAGLIEGQNYALIITADDGNSPHTGSTSQTFLYQGETALFGIDKEGGGSRRRAQLFPAEYPATQEGEIVEESAFYESAVSDEEPEPEVKEPRPQIPLIDGLIFAFQWMYPQDYQQLKTTQQQFLLAEKRLLNRNVIFLIGRAHVLRAGAIPFDFLFSETSENELIHIVDFERTLISSLAFLCTSEEEMKSMVRYEIENEGAFWWKGYWEHLYLFIIQFFPEDAVPWNKIEGKNVLKIIKEYLSQHCEIPKQE